MTTSRPVLLARPHAFIVSEMRPFLERAGFAPVKLERLDDLEAGAGGPFAAAVISTAVVSPIQASAAEVFERVRRRYPRLPVIFAGLTEFESMRSLIEQAIRNSSAGLAILPVSAETAEHPRLGSPDVVLALRKDDLSGAAAELTARILKRIAR